MKMAGRASGQESPFPLALDDSRSVLAVKGSLRRFAPWTAAGRSGESWWTAGAAPTLRYGPAGDSAPRAAVMLVIASSPSSSDRTTKANEKAKVVRFVPGLTAESATHRP